MGYFCAYLTDCYISYVLSDRIDCNGIITNTYMNSNI